MLGLLSLNSCRQDIPEQETYNNSGAFQLTSKRISLEEAKHKANLVPKIKQVETNLYNDSKNNLQGKTVNFGNGISIDTDDVIYLEKGPDFHSYTFRIDHENAPANAPIENLVISSRPDGTWKEVLVTYYLTPLERQNLLSGGTVDFTGKVTHEILQNGTYSSAIMQQDVMNCHMEISTYYTRCGESDDHHQGELTGTAGPCRSETPSVLVVSLVKKCTVALPVDTGLGENGEGGGSGPGGLGSNPPDETTTAPNLPGGPNGNSTPCISLKTKSSDTDFQDKISGLKTTDANGSAEAGYTMYSDNPTYGAKSLGSIDGNGEAYLDLEFDPNRIPNLTGFMHCHLNHALYKNLAVFSIFDFMTLGVIAENSSAPLGELGMYVTSDKGTFAIKITDKQKFLDLVNFMKSNGKDANDYYDENIQWTMTKEDQIKGLLKLMQEKAGTGIELYESDSNFTNWKRYYLDANDAPQTVKCKI